MKVGDLVRVNDSSRWPMPKVGIITALSYSGYTIHVYIDKVHRICAIYQLEVI